MLVYNVASYKTNVFSASDLVHRFFYVPKVSKLVIDHFTNSFKKCLKFVKTNSTFVVRNTKFFALEAYAYDVAVPELGCPGEIKKPETTANAPKIRSRPRHRKRRRSAIPILIELSTVTK